MPDAPEQPNTVNDLRNAFAASAESASQEKTVEQEQAKVEEPESSSRVETGTTSSSTAALKTREEILGELTPEELRAHPTLGRTVQSMVDTGVAAAMRGKTKEIEDRIRGELALNSAEKQFESLDEEELGRLLKSDPQARAAYAALQNRPTPTSPQAEQQGQVQFLTNTVKFWNGQIQAAGLPAETVTKLNPTNYLDRPGTAEEILQQWASDIQKEITTFTVGKELAKSTKQLDESKALDQQAEADRGKKGALVTNGSKTGPSHDIMQGTWRNALESAWTIKANSK